MTYYDYASKYSQEMLGMARMPQYGHLYGGTPKKKIIAPRTTRRIIFEDHPDDVLLRELFERLDEDKDLKRNTDLQNMIHSNKPKYSTKKTMSWLVPSLNLKNETDARHARELNNNTELNFF